VSKVTLKGMTWSHPRGYDPMVACSSLWKQTTGVAIEWDKRSLQDFESFPVEELLYAMMIQSANDAATALARSAAGSVPAFVDLMNAKAREIGMTHTTFRTPHGLPPANRHLADGDLTTPLDFALLSRHLVLTTDVLKYTSVKTRKFGEGVRPFDRVIVMTNHDHLLGHVDGVDGLKTGFTNGAGFCRIVRRGAGAVSVDVAHLFRSQSRIVERSADGAGGAVGARLGEVLRVG